MKITGIFMGVILGLLFTVIAATIITDNGITTPSISNNVSFTGTSYNFSQPDTSIKLYTQSHTEFGANNGESLEFWGLDPASKSYLGWYAYDKGLNRIAAVGWIGCHYNLTNGDIHSHCSWETLDNRSGTPTVNSHFEISYNSSQNLTKVGFPSAWVSNMRVDDIFSLDGDNIDFKSDSNVRVFPNKQTTIGLSLGNNSNGATISALGSVNITFVGDNVTITELAGVGEAYLCVNADGKLYRKGSACV